MTALLITDEPETRATVQKHYADSLSSYYGKRKTELHILLIKLDLFSKVFIEHFAGAENVGFDGSYRKLQILGNFGIILLFGMAHEDDGPIFCRKGFDGLVEEFRPLACDEVAVGLVGRVRDFEREIAVARFNGLIDRECLQLFLPDIVDAIIGRDLE